MSTQAIHAGASSPASTPPGFTWAARTGASLSHFGRSAWRAILESRRRRAAVELRRLAHAYAHSDPELARDLMAASNFNTTP
jgi:hypothetical protein